MAKRNKDNLRIKRKYLLWRKDAQGISEASLDKSAAAITLYDDWLGGKDFRAFHAERARSFKRHLASLRNERTGAPLSATTTNGTLRELKAFFYWMADQPSYKSKISRSDADYLTPDRKSENARRGTLWKPHPSPARARHVIETMPTGTVIERRNRALLAFLFLTGSREGAAISLPLRNLDLKSGCVQFDGRYVDTKFGKSFSTGFYPFGEFAEIILRAGLPPFSPHRVRDTMTELANDHCRTPEEFKAWSQNMGHDDVLTTFSSYGTVPPGRQMELMGRFRKRGVQDDNLFE